MIVGKRLLLFIGAFSSIYVDTGLCGVLKRRDGGNGLRNEPRGASGGQNVASVPRLELRRDEPSAESILPISASVVESGSLDTPSSPSGPAAAQLADTQARQSIPNPAVEPEISTLSSVAVSGAALVGSATGAAAAEVTTSLSAVGIKATVAASSSSGEVEDYVYPGIYGAGGTLTTDSKVPTRSVAPSRNSMLPNSGSAAGPPPQEAPTATRPVAGIPLPVPPIEEDIGQGQPVASVAPAGPTTTTTRGRRPPPPTDDVPMTDIIDNTTDLGFPAETTPGPATVTQVAPGGWNTSIQTWTVPDNRTWGDNQDGAGVSSTPLSYCQASDLTATLVATAWSVIHTSTVTWYGDPKDYTPPFPPIETPTPTPTPECVMIPLAPPRFTQSVCSSTGTGTKYVTCITTTEWNFAPVSTHTMVPVAITTVRTTDKNPAVVFPPIQTPGYGVSTLPRTKDHQAATTKGDKTTANPPPYNGGKGTQAAVNDPARDPTPKPVVVVVRPSTVIINDNTIRDNPPVMTQVVVIDGNTFTIDPTKVVGAGVTVTRPPTPGGVFLPASTGKTIGGLLVVVDSSVAVIDGTTHTIGAQPSTITAAGGQPVIIGTDGVVVIASETLSPPSLPSSTEVVVAGGEVITAIGQSVVVIHGTTITYGPDLPVKQTVIGDDTIALGPSGVIAPGTTLGGPSAKAGETQYAVVGGVTISKIGESIAVINMVTYTVGPGSERITTVVGGETVMLGPGGVAVGTQSWPWPFGAASTTTVMPGVGPSAATGEPTAAGPAGAKKSEDGAGGLRPGLGVGGGGGGGSGMVSLVCIAIGVVVFGF